MSISKKSSKGRLTSEDIREQLAKSKVFDLQITKELEKSFMDYAMSVIVSRALPDVRDGFKPVHRRILYAAYGLGMFSDRPYKKSARLVGEVIGKYHPHGDSSVYEAMVRMAQDFSMRYQLIDGHGNFGSIDGDSAAAMRYTEARLSKISDDILESIDKDTVNFTDNYDGSEQEPTVLPASFPNLLANGTNGIAVGMATSMPTHNIVEISNAIKAMILNPEISIDELMENYIKGPDFPTGAQIVGTSGIRSYFSTGRGSVTIRSKMEIEELHNGKHNLVITEIPYNVNKTSLIERIVELVKQGDMTDITDLRDESNRDGIRIVVELKRDVIPEIVFNKLCKSTQLQVNFSVNNLALVKGQPRILNLKDMIELYLEHQHDVIIRRSMFELKKAEDRAHILRGLLAAISDIDRAIKIIRNSVDVEQAAIELIQAFNIDDVQAKAILEMRLRVLSGLEHQKLTDELTKLTQIIEELKVIISSQEKRNEMIMEKLDYFVKVYGDERRTEIIEGVGSIDDEDLIPIEDIVITMSNNGWFKRMPIDTYRVQHRGGTGILAAKTHEDDSIQKIIISNTHADLLFFTTEGKVYRIRGHQVPVGSRQAKGVPANNFLNIEKTEKVFNLITVNEEDYENKYLFFITEKGIIKRVPLSEFASIRANGKIAITLDENDKLFATHITAGNDEIFIASNNAKVVRFEEESVRTLGRTARGVKGIGLEENEYVVGSGVSSEGDYVLSVGVNGVGKLTDKNEYRLTGRGAKGVTTLKINEKTGGLASVKLVNKDDQILLIANTGNIIRLKAENISEIGRSTSGVKLMDLEDNEKIQFVAAFKATDEEEIENENTHNEDNEPIQTESSENPINE